MRDAATTTGDDSLGGMRYYFSWTRLSENSLRLGMMIEVVTDGWMRVKAGGSGKKQARRVMTSVDTYK
jgi:hypothetical protein